MTEEKKPDEASSHETDAAQDATAASEQENAPRGDGDAPSSNTDAAPEATVRTATTPSDGPATPTVVDEAVGQQDRRLGTTALWLSLINFLLVLGVAALGYLGFQSIQNQRHLQEQKVTALQDRTSDLDVTRQSRSQWFTQQEERLSDQADQLQSLARRIETQDKAFAQLEANLSTLAEKVQGGESAWQEAEVEYLLLMANNRLQLMGDVSSAIIALKLADQRLAGMANPAYLPVRNALRRELSALEAVPEVDTQSIALQLGSMIDQAEQLPLRKPAVGQFDTELDIASLGEGQDWMARTWDAINDTVSSLITIRRDETRREPTLPPEQEDYLRQNIRMQLESARLATLRQDKGNYQVALRQAEDWIRQYFDRSQTVTSALLRQIGELLGRELAPARPDISGSLKALRAVEPSA